MKYRNPSIEPNLTLKASSDEAYGFNHRYYNRGDSVLKGLSKKKDKSDPGIPPSLQDGWIIYDLPVVETTGFIPLSLRDKDLLETNKTCT
ncbi:MAG TPA: hypothetical protein DET40_22785 [Lentisphaeria bacterium]|nr:MAG: hypothetical protein A2X45_16005 [Lentisphaerae bacterium GWF2_50_93]HCE46381.1 hypothetical protein [Lentisphaeria bacterium]